MFRSYCITVRSFHGNATMGSLRIFYELKSRILTTARTINVLRSRRKVPDIFVQFYPNMELLHVFS